MKRLLFAVLLLLSLAVPALADERAYGFCSQGGQRVAINNQSSSTFWQQSYPSCTVTVFLTGTTTLATIFSDNSSTAKANPFTASSTGYWFFYADNGVYDVRLSNGGIPAPFTLAGIQLLDTGSSSFALLTAIENLSSNGLVTRTSSSTAAARTITGTTNITVTDGNGVSGNPTLSLATTISGVTISGAANTLTVLAGSQLTGQVPMANGGTGASLADPGADRLLFWDDSGGVVTFLNAASCISGTTWTCTSTGTVTGTGTTNTVPKFTSASAIGNSNIIDDGTTVEMSTATRITSGSLSVNGDFTAQAQIHEKSTANMLAMEETDAAANAKVWRWQMSAGALSLVTLTDAYATGQTLLSVSRSGSTISAINWGNVATTLSGFPFTTTMGAVGFEDASAVQDLTMYRSSAGGNGNSVSSLTMQGKDSGGTKTTFVALTSKSATFTDGAEAGQFDIALINAGASVTASYTTTLFTLPQSLALGTAPATTGLIRIPTNSSLVGRDTANMNNRTLLSWGVTATDLMVINDISAPQALRIYGTELAADPTAPSTNQFVIYAKDTGAAKTTLCARFATGAVQCFASEP